MARGRARIERHAANHLPGGSDPISGGCCDTSTGGAANYETGVLAISDLVGYWRLGDGGFDFLDTSGYNPGDPADMVLNSGTTPMTQDFTPGALTVDDDGAVQFNADGTSVTPVSGESMHAVFSTDTHRFDFAGTAAFTISCWIRPLASAHTYTGTIFGTLAISGGNDNGWRLHIDEPSRVVGFARAPNVSTGVYPTVSSPAGLDADTWHHLVGTYDGATLRLYLNGTLVASQADVSVMSVTANPPYIGTGPAPMASYTTFFYGAVDEAAIWSKALTAGEVATLYNSAGGPAVTAGKVLTADGDGGTSYEWPTISVDGTRYDEILTGANLSSTDNSDGTVTIDATGGGDVTTDDVWDAKGDLVVASGADAADNLSVGTDGQILTADAASPLGVKWAAAPASGATADDTACWMPLTTTVGGDDILVFDADHSLIPTLVPLA